MDTVKSLLSEMSNLSGPRRKFLQILFATMMYLPGKVNYRNLSRYSGLSEMSYLRHFRTSFDFATFNQRLIERAMASDHQRIAVLDCSFIPKSGKKTYGLDRFFNGKAARVEKGLEVSQLAIVDIDASFGFSLSTAQTGPSGEIGAQEENRIDGYVKHLGDHKARLKEMGITCIATDGYYTKKRFIDGAVTAGFHLVGKLRQDANLRYLYTGPRKGGRGAPRRYDGKVCYDDFSRWEKVAAWDKITLYSLIVNAPQFKRNLHVVCLLDQTDPEKPRHTLFFSTDLTLAAMTLYTFYKARFQIEFLFRDAKQFTGLADCQARDQQALTFHFNASFTTLNLLRLQDRMRHRNLDQNPCSIASWKARLYHEHLLDRFIYYLDLNPEWIKNHPGYLQLTNYGSIAA